MRQRGMKPVPSFKHLSDAELTSEVARLVRAERAATASLLASLAEFDRRRLFLPAGYSSLFVYCRDHLHLGDGASYRRIEAARASRRFPPALELIAGGFITLTNFVLIAPFLSEANHVQLLEEITHKTRPEVEVIVARLKPKPDVASLIRRVPAVRTPSPENHPVETNREKAVSPVPAIAVATRSSSRPIVAPLSPERYKLQITMSQETHDTLREVQALMRHSIPSGDVALILERALTCLLQELRRRKTGARRSDFRKEDDPKRPEPGGHAGLFH